MALEERPHPMPVIGPQAFGAGHRLHVHVPGRLDLVEERTGHDVAVAFVALRVTRDHPEAAGAEDDLGEPGGVEERLVHHAAEGLEVARRPAHEHLDLGLDRHEPAEVDAEREPRAGEVGRAGGRGRRRGLEVQALFGKRHRVAVVRPGERAEQSAHVLDRPGHRTLDVRDQRVPAELGRVERHPPRRRADPDEAVEGGRNPDRAPEVGAEAGRREPSRDRRAGTPARPPGGAVDVPGVAGGPEDRVRGVDVVGELGGVGLPEHDRARGPQPFDADGVLLRDVVLQDLRAEGRADPPGEDVVLDDDRRPLQQPRHGPAGEPPVDRIRLVERRVVQGADGVEGRVDRLHPGERRLDDLAGAHRAPPDLPRDARGRVLRQVLVHCFAPQEPGGRNALWSMVITRRANRHSPPRRTIVSS